MPPEHESPQDGAPTAASNGLWTAMSYLHRNTAILSLCATLVACAGTQHLDADASRRLYLDAHQAVQRGDYAAAVGPLKRITEDRQQQPYSAQAAAELAYSYYKRGDYAAAKQTADKFIQRYPTHARADYVHYLRAAASLLMALNLYETGTEQRAAALDESFGHFQTLSQRFPGSAYNETALRSLMFIRQQQALTHLEQAKGALRGGDFKAGIAGVHYVSDEFRGTPAAQEATALLDNPAALRAVAQPVPAPAPPATAVAALPAVTAAPERAGDSAATAPVSDIKIPIHDPQWILQQDPGRYTVELIPAASDATVRQFVDTHNIHGSARFPTADDQARTTLIHGLYPDAASARMAANQLIKRWGLRDAPVRRLAEVQSSLTTDKNLTAPPP